MTGMWLNVRDALLGLSLAAGVITAAIPAALTSWWSTVARELEAALVGAPLALPLLRLPGILFLLFLKNAVCELLSQAFHALHPLPSGALSGNTEASSSCATA